MPPANGVDNQFDSAPAGHFLQNGEPVLIAIVDCVVQAALLQKSVFSRTCGSVGRGSKPLRNVERSQSYASARVMNQYRFTRLETAHYRDQRIRREVVDRNGG